MTLATGFALGPYVIVGPLGAGGMGEVFRARDNRLGRDVALKILPGDVSGDPDRLRRFEQEARAASALNHPNILTVFDVGSFESVRYIVAELLEGETLRQRLAEGRLPLVKALETAAQVARGLAAAHEKGIVHRDLKPENIFVTTDGRVKILDFGLAKPVGPDTRAAAAALSTQTEGTTPGSVLGTVGYMAPEQARGHAADHRADLFALGCVLYEMLTGRRAFHGDSAADTLAAVLREDVPDLSSSGVTVPPAVDQLLRRCIEKNPAERWQSARDLAFALDTAARPSGVGGSPGTVTPAVARTRWTRIGWAIAGVVALAAALLAGSRLAPHAPAAAPHPTFRQLTFERGTVHDARFAPDGQTVVFAAEWNGEHEQIFETRADQFESNRLALPSAGLFSISESGEMLVSLDWKPEGWLKVGTLARVGLLGSSPRAVMESVHDADWIPGTSEWIVTRREAGRHQLEFPAGHVVYKTSGYVGYPRVSPDGGLVAFEDHPISTDNRGCVAVVDRKGHLSRITPEWGAVEGLAWSPDGREVWFSGQSPDAGWHSGLYAARVHAVAGEKPRALWSVPRDLVLLDVHRSGRALVSAGAFESGAYGAPPDATNQVPLRVLAFSAVRGITPDGRSALMTNYDPPSGIDYQVFLKPFGPGSAISLGPGEATDISSDGRWVLSITPSGRSSVMLLPMGAGESRAIPTGDLNALDARFHPDGHRVLVVGTSSDAKLHARLFSMTGDAGPGQPLPAMDEALSRLGRYRSSAFRIAPDGRRVAVGEFGETYIVSLDGGALTKLPQPAPSTERLVSWTTDGRQLVVSSWTGNTGRIERLDPATGRRELVRTIEIPDPAGRQTTPRVMMSPDLRAYGYFFVRWLNALYIVDGLK